MRSRDDASSRRHSLIAVVFLVCAVVLGGGGSPNPNTELVLQLVFVAAALLWLWVPAKGGMPVPHSRTFWPLCALVLALPVLQLVPLPPVIWSSLAGQEDRVASLALVGREDSWQPLSHSPPRTLASLLAMIPALFAFFAAAALDARGRMRLVGTIAAMALATTLLGAVQLSLGSEAPYLYAQNHPNLTGFQANRNAAADLLLIGIAAAAAYLAPSLAPPGALPEGRRIVRERGAAALVLAGVLAALFFATLLTASRTGIALLPLAIAGVGVILWPALVDRRRWRLAPVAAALLVIPVVAFVALRGGNTALGTVAERFVFSDDARRALWEDAWFATTQNWPFGVGLGGAQPSLIAAERLEVLDPSQPNRVHNDYLELALEGGLPALLLLLAIAALLAWSAWRSWRERPEDRAVIAVGIVALLVAAAHSFVDYPLRSMALACLIGTGAGLLMRTPAQMAAQEPGQSSGEAT